MEHASRFSKRTFLTTAPANPTVVRTAWVVGLLSLVSCLSVLPIAKTPIGPISSFVPIYTSFLAIFDLITAVVLYGQYRVLGSRGVLVLASGYLFTAASTTAYALIFPGVLAPSGLFGPGPQSTSAMYMFWHTGFPLIVIVYGFVKGAPATGQERRPSRKATRRAVVLSVVVTLTVVAAFLTLATGGNGLLPDLLVNNVTTALGHLFLYAIWGLNVTAFVLLFLRRPHSVLDIWLLFVLAVWVFDLALSAAFNSGRYDLGWYVGRVYGLIGSGFLLVTLLSEFIRNYGRLFELSDALSQANTALEELSFLDSLTGLANRRSFDEYIVSQFGAAKRLAQPVALVICDVDHFKLYNDRYGHQAGDDCLQRVAAAIQACCRRPTDRACRYGGEEFAVILPGIDGKGAAQIAEQFRESVAKLNLPHGASPSGHRVTLSAGVAVEVPTAIATVAELIQAADAALYQAKREGRNRVVVSVPLAQTRPKTS
jgi:diguanylate cyclase (GGDEF)-like protein